MKQYKNFALSQPQAQVVHFGDTIGSSIQLGKWIMLQEAEKFTFEKFVEYNNQWLKTGKLICFAAGNLTKEDALLFVDELTESIPLRDVNHEDLLEVRPTKFPTDKIIQIHKTSENPLEENNCAMVVFQNSIASDEREEVLFCLLLQYLKQPVFNTLRTKEQLGYSVHTLHPQVREVSQIAILVQSSQKSPEYLVERIMLCLQHLLANLEDLSAEQFETMKESVKTKLNVKDLTLAVQMARYWERIVNRKFAFDYKEKQVLMLAEITK